MDVAAINARAEVPRNAVVHRFMMCSWEVCDQGDDLGGLR
jgi:hypothetical protein